MTWQNGTSSHPSPGHVNPPFSGKGWVRRQTQLRAGADGPVSFLMDDKFRLLIIEEPSVKFEDSGDLPLETPV